MGWPIPPCIGQGAAAPAHALPTLLDPPHRTDAHPPHRPRISPWPRVAQSRAGGQALKRGARAENVARKQESVTEHEALLAQVTTRAGKRPGPGGRAQRAGRTARHTAPAEAIAVRALLVPRLPRQKRLARRRLQPDPDCCGVCGRHSSCFFSGGARTGLWCCRRRAGCYSNGGPRAGCFSLCYRWASTHCLTLTLSITHTRS